MKKNESEENYFVNFPQLLYATPKNVTIIKFRNIQSFTNKFSRDSQFFTVSKFIASVLFPLDMLHPFQNFARHSHNFKIAILLMSFSVRRRLRSRLLFNSSLKTFPPLFSSSQRLKYTKSDTTLILKSTELSHSFFHF